MTSKCDMCGRTGDFGAGVILTHKGTDICMVCLREIVNAIIPALLKKTKIIQWAINQAYKDELGRDGSGGNYNVFEPGSNWWPEDFEKSGCKDKDLFAVWDWLKT